MSNRIVFWTNFDRRQMKSKRKFFLKISKISVKHNMDQTVLSLDQNTCFDQKTKLVLCFLNKPDQIRLALL